MRILRYARGGEVRYGIVDGQEVYDLAGDLFGQFQVGRRVCALNECKILAPVQPSKVVAIGLNYRDHAAESHMELPAEPLIFLKPPSSVIGHEDDIVYPKMSHRVDYESELAVVIGKRAHDVSVAEASQFVLGLTCGNDITARDLQGKDGQWSRAKGFDTFCALGPWIVTEMDGGCLPIRGMLNGQVKQDSDTSNLIFSIPQLVSFVSQVMTLLPGDVIMTGTPSGIGPMNVGDVFEVELAGIGVLRNRLVAPA